MKLRKTFDSRKLLVCTDWRSCGLIVVTCCAQPSKENKERIKAATWSHPDRLGFMFVLDTYSVERSNIANQAIPLVDYIVTETGRLRGKTSLADAHSCKSLSLRGSR